MNNTKKHARLACLALAVVISLAAANPVADPAQSIPTPPGGWYGYGSCGVSLHHKYTNGFNASVIVSPEDKTVTIAYQPSGAVLVNRALNNKPKAETKVEYNTWYWPVAVDWTDDGTRLVVVGVSPRDGITTVVETWTFAGAPFFTEVVPPAGGNPSILWTIPKQEDVKLRLYKDLGIGKPVGFIDHNKALGGDDFIVGFRGHGTVYALNLQSALILPMASSLPGLGLQIPQLDLLSKDMCSSFDHIDVGFCYKIFDGGKHLSVYLIDSDRDGILDDFDRPGKLPPGMHRFATPSPKITWL